MIILNNGVSSIMDAWGMQTNKEGSYRKFRYLLETRTNDGLLLHNTVTGEVVLLDAAEKEAWKQLPCIPSDSLQELLAHHFLVPETSDDLKTVNSLRMFLRRLMRSKEITEYTILPTTACNARCFYCYESDYPHLTMKKGAADDLLMFILTHCGRSKELKLNWFGGEPLLGKSMISYICGRLREEGIDFRSKMISNGYLFTPELAKLAKADWNLQKVQITLDGTEDIYNRTKAYVNVTGSPYQKVLDNIRTLLSEDIRVSVRMNLDTHNTDDLERLIDELAARFSEYDNFSCYVHELFDHEGFQTVTHTEEEWNSLKDRKTALLSLIAKKGLQSARSKKDLASLRKVFCMADSPFSVTVNPLGQIGKCEHYAYSHLVGDTVHGITDKAEWNSWLNSSYFDKCSLCALYPACGILCTCQLERPCSPSQASFRMARCQQIAKELLANVPEK